MQVKIIQVKKDGIPPQPPGFMEKALHIRSITSSPNTMDRYQSRIPSPGNRNFGMYGNILGSFEKDLFAAIAAPGK